MFKQPSLLCLNEKGGLFVVKRTDVVDFPGIENAGGGGPHQKKILIIIIIIMIITVNIVHILLIYC